MISIAKRGARVWLETLPQCAGDLRYRFVTDHPKRSDKFLFSGWRVLDNPGPEIRRLVALNDGPAKTSLQPRLCQLDSLEEFTEFQDDPDEQTPRMLYVYRNGNLWVTGDPRLIRDTDVDGEAPGNVWRRLIDAEEQRMIAPEVGYAAALGSVSRVIPVEVRREVWRRDLGRCTVCGSRERLEFDHVIPVSMGGSNTVRNIQLLCESCNRSKGANLG